MIRTHTRWKMVAAASALTVLVTACSAGGPDNGPQQANTDDPVPKGVTLTLWRSPLDSPEINRLYKAYEAASGNKLNIVEFPSDGYESTVVTKWATGKKPDILGFPAGLSQFSQLNPVAKLIDLTSLPFVKRSGEIAESAGNLNGHVYAAVLGPLNSYGLFYNKEVFASAKLEVPKTYDELMTVCKALKRDAPGVAPIFEAGGDSWPPQILAGLLYEGSANKGGVYVKDLLDGKRALNEPDGEFVRGLTAYDGLRKAGCFNADATTAKFGDSAKALVDGKAAMVAQLSEVMIPQLEGDNKTTENIGFVGLSADGPHVSYNPGLLGTFYVPKTGDATKERAAIGFIEWITGPGYAKYIEDVGGTPTLSGVPTPPIKGLRAEVATAYDTAAAYTWLLNLPGATSVGDLALQVLAGQISPQTAGDRMDIAFRQARDQMNQ